MERLSAERFLEHVRATNGFGLVWFPDEEPVMYVSMRWSATAYLGPDPAETDDVLYSVFLAKLRILLGKKYRGQNKVSTLVDCDMAIRHNRALVRLYDWFRWGHTLHICCRPRSLTKEHYGDHRCKCKKTWRITLLEV